MFLSKMVIIANEDETKGPQKNESFVSLHRNILATQPCAFPHFACSNPPS